MNQENLESIVNKKQAVVDTASGITYSWIVGSVLDYYAGLNFSGIVVSRTSATALNFLASAPYGWWKDQIYKWTKTNKESSRFRKYFTDLLAFNTGQTLLYATSLAIGGLVSEGKLNWEKVKNGVEYVAIVSPLIGPLMNIYMDYARRLFKLKTSAEKSINR